MPPKENEYAKIYLISEDGQKIMLSDEIPEIEIEPNTINNKIHRVDVVSKPFTGGSEKFVPERLKGKVICTSELRHL